MSEVVDRIEPLDFASALVEKAGGWEELNPSLVEETEQAQAEDTSDVYQDDDGNWRDASGKFTSAPEEDEEPEEQELPEISEEQEKEPGEEFELEDYVLEIDDPQLESYLEKYDGDIGKALKAAAHQTDLIGRQGQEMGDLRSRLDQLTQHLLAQSQAPAAQGPSIDALIDSALDTEDPAGALSRVAYEAYRRQDPEGLGRTIAAWKEEDEYSAAVFVGGLQAELMKAEVLESLAAREAEGQQNASLGAAISEVVKRHPDVEHQLPAMAKVAQELPILQAALEYGNATEKAQAFEALYVLASSQRVADTSKEAMRKVAVKTQREAREAKAQAAVLSASRRKSAGEEPTRVDSFKQAFRQATGLPEEDE